MIADNESNYQPSLAIIFGYLPKIDNQSSVAARLGLLQRFSIALDSYHPEKVEPFFDQQMFVDIMAELLEFFDFDLIKVDLPERTLMLKSWKTVFASEDLPLALTFFKQNLPVLYMESENYVDIGGPDPYHDCYSFSYYVKEIDIEKLERGIGGLCRQRNYHIRAIEFGQEHPEKESFWRRMWHFFC